MLLPPGYLGLAWLDCSAKPRRLSKDYLRGASCIGQGPDDDDLPRTVSQRIKATVLLILPAASRHSHTRGTHKAGKSLTSQVRKDFYF